MTNEEQTQSVKTAEQTVDGVVRIGRLWAVYGLEIGRAALRTTAETLKTTSELLGTISKQIDERHDAPSAPPDETEQLA